jgi:putative oxidoreductase
MRIEIEEAPPVEVSLAFTLLRVVTGVILVAHGWLKLADLAGWQAQVAQLGLPEPATAATLAIAGELLGGAGLVLGRYTRVAAIGAASVMIVAIATVHLNHGLLAQRGGFEYPLILLCVSLLFVAMGGGRWSADRFMRERARRRAIQADERWSQPPYVASPNATYYAERELHRARGPFGSTTLRR